MLRWRRSWQFRNVMRSGGETPVCYISKLSQSVRCPKVSRSQRKRWKSTKPRVFHGENVISHFSFAIGGLLFVFVRVISWIFFILSQASDPRNHTSEHEIK